MTTTNVVAPVSSAYGITQGAFSVDASGQASYLLEIDVPPGIGGMQPKLDLHYSHHQGNGVLGVGWALGGLSAISRIKANYAVDGFNGGINYDGLDRYALDGQRLINVDGDYGQLGTTYYTEIQSWKRVTQNANGAFTVNMKNGETWRYGDTPNSRILAAGGSEIRVWALSSIEDLHGNRIEYQYTQSPVTGAKCVGAYFIEKIAYTVREDFAANRFVTFTYEARNDPLVTYVGGYPIQTSCRLNCISTWVGDTLARSYGLRFVESNATGLSCLNQLILGGSSSATAIELPPINFGWQDTVNPKLVQGTRTGLDQHLDTVGTLTADVSGSGRSDLVQLWLNQSGELQATVYSPSGTGAEAQYVAFSSSSLGSFPSDRQIMAADLNGDGRTDLLVVYADPVTQNLILAAMLSDGSSFIAQEPHDTGDAWSAHHLAFYSMDVNGDGRTDLVETFGTQDPNQGSLLTFRTILSNFGGTGPSFSTPLYSTTSDPATPSHELATWPVDVNGNGMVDIVRVWQDGSTGEIHVSSYLSVSTALDQVSFVPGKDSNLGTFSLAGQLAFLPVDVNADGLMDLLQVWQESGPSGTVLHLSTFLSDGSGGFVQGPDSAFPNQGIDPKALLPMNFSGGGQTQLLSRWFNGTNMRFSVYGSSPSGIFRLLADVDAGEASPHAKEVLLAGDVTGEGKACLIRLTEGQYNITDVVPYLPTGEYPDLLASITNQIGAVTTVRYAALSDPSVYTASDATEYPLSSGLRMQSKLAPTQFPVQAVLGQSLQVVAGYTETNNRSQNRFEHSHEFSYTYTGARIDMLGRGWQGFATVSKLNLKTGQRVIQQYLQSFPMMGALEKISVEADSRYSSDPRIPQGETAVLLTHTVNEYAAVTRATGVSGQTIQEVLLTSTQTSHYDYGSANFDFAIGKCFGYDDYGNKTVDTYLGYVDPTTGAALVPTEVVYRFASFANDPERWVLGTATSAKATSNPKSSATPVFQAGDFHLESRTYNPGTNTLASVARWDSSNNVYLSTGYSYDESGNRIEESAPGGVVISYTFDQTYRTYTAQVIGPANVAGERLQTSHGFDPRYGVEIARIDENGSVFVSCLDGFGRPTQRQGPLPLIVGAVSDNNKLSSLVTGSADMRQAFLSASVITLEVRSYLDDGTGGIYLLHQDLQAFPLDSARVLLGKRTYKDALGRDAEISQETGQVVGDAVVQIGYDAAGNKDRSSLPYFAGAQISWITSSYDVLNRQISQRQPVGVDGSGITETSWVYGAGGAVIHTLATGCSEAYARKYVHHLFDGKDKVIQAVALGDGNATTTFSYDALGRLLSCTDPATPSNPDGVRNAYTHDSFDRLTHSDNPDQNTSKQPGTFATLNSWDSVTGRLKQQTDASGCAINFHHDESGRVVRKLFSDGRSVSFVYDSGTGAKARLSTVLIQDKAGGVESQQDFSYDVYGNLATQKLQVGLPAQVFVTRNTYDPQNRLVEQIQPDDTILTRVYEGGMLLTQEMDGATLTYPIEQRTASGRFGQVDYGSCITDEFIFDPHGQLYAETLTAAGAVVVQAAYTYDSLNQLLSVADTTVTNVATQDYTYRERRLVTAVHSGQTDCHYEYDVSGNLISKNGQDYTYRAHFPCEITGVSGTVYEAAYDACGRLARRTSGGVTLNFDYDGLGTLHRVTDASGESVCDIISDHTGQRLQQTDNSGRRRIYVHPGYVADIQDDVISPIKYLCDANGIAGSITGDRSSAEVRYFRRDHKGSITLILGPDGVIHDRLSFDAYGIPLAPSSAQASLPGYEQRNWDNAIGLYYFGARYFDPVVGRFTCPDTVLGAQGIAHADVWNRFAFELNDPINHTDPTGHMAEWVKGLLVGLAAVALGAVVLATGGSGIGVTVLAGALIGGGASAVGYSANNTENFTWKNFAIQAGVGAVIGGVTGGLVQGLGPAIARSAYPLLYGAVLGAVAGGVSGAVGQVLTNWLSGEEVSSGVGQSAFFGAAFGLIAGGLGEATEQAGRNIGAAERRAANDIADINIEMQPLNHQANQIPPGEVLMPRVRMMPEVSRRILRYNPPAQGFLAVAGAYMGSVKLDSNGTGA